jgi:transglutaminase 1
LQFTYGGKSIWLLQLNVFLLAPSGERPQESKGTVLRIPVTVKENGKPLSNEDWSAVLQNHLKSSAEIKVVSPPDAIVGRYHVFVEAQSGPDKEISRKEFDSTFVLLFNAWCKGTSDSCFMLRSMSEVNFFFQRMTFIWRMRKSGRSIF